MTIVAPKHCQRARLDDQNIAARGEMRRERLSGTPRLVLRRRDHALRKRRPPFRNRFAYNVVNTEGAQNPLCREATLEQSIVGVILGEMHGLRILLLPCCISEV